MATIVKVGKAPPVSGTAGNDTIFGADMLINVINGMAGNDTITGGSQNDILIGGAGSDTIYGGGGNDAIWGGGAADTLQGGLGNDSLYGDGGSDHIYGGAGDDLLNGGAGGDIMDGGAGNDVYQVDSLLDVIIETSGGGTDTVVTSLNIALPNYIENLVLVGGAAIGTTGNALNNTITGNAAGNTIGGGDGNDTLSGAGGVDVLNGGAGVDTIYGGTGNDSVFGGGGNDVIYGDAGDDRIYADGGNDKIFGGAGNDVLFGGQLKSGFSLGNDTFAWARADVINAAGARQGYDHVCDFAAGDRLDFTGLALGAAALASLVHVTDTATGTVISANFGGTLGFVDVVVLDGVHNKTLLDFVHSNAILV